MKGYNLPNTIGVYIFKKKAEVLYIGKSINIRARVKSHIENAKLDPKEAAIVNQADNIDHILTDSEFKALLLEAKLIQKYQPKYNFICRDDKSYLYVMVTAADQYPKIGLIRKSAMSSDKSLYFGPFPSSRIVEEILKEIRKIIPYCTQKKIGKKPCFYSKIGLCSPCPGEIETVSNKSKQLKLRSIYRRNLKQIIRVFKGDSDIVFKQLYKKLKKLSKQQKYEQAIRFRDKIIRFEHFLTNQEFGTDYCYNQSTERVQSLLKLLRYYFPYLNKLNRIECFDISNLFQRDATASMVVFVDGMADKNEYRRFRIKSKTAKSDTEMLEEVISRRLKRNWSKPDLIVVDGGRPQVRKMASVTAKFNLSIPIVGIAKRPDRLIVGNANFVTIRPSFDHIGFNLIRLIRDESHRFARKYHLLLRKKRMMI